MAALELFVWFAVGMFVWIVTLSSVSPAELIAGAIASLLVAVLALAIRRAMNLSWRPLLAWPGWACLAAAAAALDTVRLVRRFGPTGPRTRARFVRRQLPRGADAATTAQRIGAVLAVSSTAGSICVDADPETGVVLVHRLVAGWPDLDRRVTGE